MRQPGMHWSRPAAVQSLAVLRDLGGVATTLQIHERTRSQAVHSEVASLRCYAWAELGIPDTVDPVSARLVSTYRDEDKRLHRVYEYRLCEGLGGPGPAVQSFSERKQETVQQVVSAMRGERAQGAGQQMRLCKMSPKFRDEARP